MTSPSTPPSSNATPRPRRLLAWGLLPLLALLVAVGLPTGPTAPDATAEEWALTPWQAIGGCGAGGSGGGAGDGIKWVGQGVDGGLLNLELMGKRTTGQTFSQFSLTPRLSFKPSWSSELGLTVPFVSKQGEVQYRTNQTPNDRTTGGLGDIALDYALTFGSNNQLSLRLGLGLPTGQYDIARGADAAKEFLPASLQKGSGLYLPSVGLGYTKDVENGLWLWDLTYSHPMAFSANGRNPLLDSWYDNYSGVQDDRFRYTLKPYGENPLGAYTPPALATSLTYGYRGEAGMVHSVGLTFAVPLGVAWIPSEKSALYDPRPDPDHKAWSAALSYGLEFSRKEYPLFLGFSLPLHDQANAPGADEYASAPMSQWDGPDWKDALQQWTLAVGLKTALFAAE
jgi:hypothetical protein